ncbi:phosphatase PAP2 family protein [Nitrincola tapanii]|uniref:Phosphatase PAP2 family protein n=1 Tax=Nitrincola tapanii TaxID=1708751 RepID=A0A5A9W6X3_9GAMM|nr:phosphatase PAP2 family protein [Nitrincola tapanii]KAA0876194.1 phosphatase PAP2 family protein [Nitrincola tapanii]
MTPHTPVFSNQWQIKPLLTLHLIALVLMLSFIWPSGQDLWRSLDERIFLILNGSLAEGGTWAWFWAWANTRYKDLALAVVMLAFLVFPGPSFRAPQLQQALVGFLALILLLLPFRYVIYEIAKLLELSGPSPSLVLQPAYMLTELFPNISAKDASGRSFPGDHATVMVIWAGYLLWNSPLIGRLLALALTLFAILPRMVGGAHWFSDVAVGGLAIALPVLAWGFYSPLLLSFTLGLQRVFTPVFQIFGKLPLLKRLAFFRARS